MSKEPEFVIIGNTGGYYDEDRNFVVCEEYGLTDADTDKYFVEVNNHEGYYNSEGRFVRLFLGVSLCHIQILSFSKLFLLN